MLTGTNATGDNEPFEDDPAGLEDRGPEPKIERRKIQLSGRTTFVVSLPKNWVKAANLEAGDTVGIDVQDDGSLVVIPESVRRRRALAVQVDATGMDADALLRELMATYLAGFDMMTVTGRAGVTDDQRQAVKRMTEMTVGFEVVEETPRQIVLQDMVDPTQFASRGGLQRLCRIAVGMTDDALTAVETRDLKLAESVIARDDSVDRMYLMIAKQHVHLLSDISMARRKQVTLKESLFLSQAARALERCGDHAARISYALKESDLQGPFPPEVWKSVRELAAHSTALLQRAVAAFMRADQEAAHKVIAESKRLTKERGTLTRLLLTTDEHEVLVLSLVVESLERIHQYGSDIAEAALAHSAARHATGQAAGARRRK